MVIRSIFEVGPPDQGARAYETNSVRWNVLLPMCDGNVPNMNGIGVFDRNMQDFSETTPQNKSAYGVWGANHNFYNTEWKSLDRSDIALDCIGQRPLFSSSSIGSAEQRQTGFMPML